MLYKHIVELEQGTFGTSIVFLNCINLPKVLINKNCGVINLIGILNG